MGVAIQVREDDSALVQQRSRILDLANAAAERIVQLLPLSDVDVLIGRDTAPVIPELGIGGFSPDGHSVRIGIDPDHEGFADAIDAHLPRILAHEFHHCARWRGPGDGRTLAEALVSEGLADHFDLKVHAGAQPYHWSGAVDGPELEAVWRLAGPKLWEPGYEHAFWFFNQDAGSIPFHSGYALGFRLVGSYLEANPSLRPSQLANISAEAVLADVARL